MKNTRTSQAIHDTNGNIKSMSVTTSSLGAQVTMAPEKGYYVSQVDLSSAIPDDFQLAGEEDANRLRKLFTEHRVDISRSSSLVKK